MAPRSSVLVTGGAGYIGSHACAALAARGYEPVVYDDFSLGNAWAVKWGPSVTGSVLDAQRLTETMAAFQPIAVMHFAALSQVGESHAKADTYFAVNVGGTRNVVAAMRATGVETIVLSSTAAVYGDASTMPLTEETPPNPVNPYGATKLEAERILAAEAAKGGFRYAALRYFNAAGAHREAVIGEAHEPETHLIPRLLRSLLASGAGMTVDLYGNDYDTPDGTCVRDYIHVHDLAEAHVGVLGHLAGGGDSVVANLGLGRGFSVRQVIAAVEEVTGRRLAIAERPRRPGDPALLIADPGMAVRRFGFAAEYRDLGAIIDSAWRWHRQFHAQSPA